MSTSVEDYIQEVFGKEALETMPPEIRSIVLEMGKILSEYQTPLGMTQPTNPPIQER